MAPPASASASSAKATALAAAGSAASALWAAALAPGSSPWLKTFVAGAGFMSDAYDLFIIDVVKNVMSELYPQSAAQTAAVSTAALVGAVLGQLVFGALADKVGRRVIFMVTLTLVVLSSLGSATITDDGKGAIYAQLAAWRFLLGFGVGGEYPLSATITSEGAATRSRGYAVALVFAMQGVGKILAAAVNASCLSSGMSLDSAWRFALGFGSVPGLLTVYHRWKIEESHHFKAVLHADNGGARGEAEAAAEAGAAAAAVEAAAAIAAAGQGVGDGEVADLHRAAQHHQAALGAEAIERGAGAFDGEARSRGEVHREQRVGQAERAVWHLQRDGIRAFASRCAAQRGVEAGEIGNMEDRVSDAHGNPDGPLGAGQGRECVVLARSSMAGF